MENLRFNSEGKFKIMLIADIQDSNNIEIATQVLINTALEVEAPDLVILLGDVIWGAAPELLFSQKNIRDAICVITEPITSREIPFYMVFGNHDTETIVGKAAQYSIYSEQRGFLNLETFNDSGYGNAHVFVYDSLEEKPIVDLWFFDTGNLMITKKGIGYSSVRKPQIDWFESTREINANEYGSLPAYIFQHIPVPEINKLLEYTNTPVKESIPYQDGFLSLKSGEGFSGTIKERPCSSLENAGQFESWVNDKNVVAAYFGHDHVNTFVGKYKNIDLGYSPGVGFRFYGDGVNRGVRIIELRKESPREYTTYLRTYSDLINVAEDRSFKCWDYVLGYLFMSFLLILLIILVSRFVHNIITFLRNIFTI